MRPIALLFLLTLYLSCEQPSPQVKSTTSLDSNVPPAYVSIDTIDGQQFRAIIQEGKNIILISESELQFVDRLLQQQIEEHNRNSDKSYFIDLSKYNRQYFPSIDTNGEKIIEVNCFCQVHNNDDWKKQRVHVKDGGECYFNLIVNINTKSVLSFYINGEA